MVLNYRYWLLSTNWLNIYVFMPTNCKIKNESGNVNLELEVIRI